MRARARNPKRFPIVRRSFASLLLADSPRDCFAQTEGLAKQKKQIVKSESRDASLALLLISLSLLRFLIVCDEILIALFAIALVESA